MSERPVDKYIQAKRFVGKRVLQSAGAVRYGITELKLVLAANYAITIAVYPFVVSSLLTPFDAFSVCGIPASCGFIVQSICSLFRGLQDVINLVAVVPV